MLVQGVHAHHSVEAEYGNAQKVNLKGVVSELYRTHPHVRIYGRTGQFGIPRFSLSGISIDGGEEEWLAAFADDRQNQN